MCVYDAPGSITETISNARRYVKIYDDTEGPYRLIQGTANLYKVVLVALQNILKVFTESSKRKLLKAVTPRMDDYGDTLLESIEDIKMLVAKVETKAEICSQERMRRMDEKLHQSVKLQTDSSDMHTEMYETLYRLLIGSGQATRKTPVRNKIKEYDPDRDAGVEMKNKGMKPSRFLELLEYDEAALDRDQREAKRAGPLLDTVTKDRVSFIASSPQLYSWLVESRRSRALLINGNDKGHLVSPLSYLCAEMAQLYQEADFSLIYFCGLNSGYRDHRADACGMMISLIGQITEAQIRPDMSFLDDKRLLQKATNGKINAHCRVFRNLVKQLPTGMVVYCFIDMISIYETRERRDDILLVPKHINGNRQGVVNLRGLKTIEDS
ncbi:hypothetical protein EDC01DRAFT_753862 [Geopyxis carbonaria]|nr:hypothetical protein EDC01DRAFT_753862 [Geopyxis carbonaria]